MLTERETTQRNPASDFAILRQRVQAELFANMPVHVRRLGWDAGQVAAFQRSRLRALLASAKDQAGDGCIAEFVDSENRPVPPGAQSAKVLITNLYNHVQPLIRYELGDSCIRRPDAPEHGHPRVTVEGRSDEILRYENADIHPLVLRSVLVASPAVSDYQVRQTPSGIAVAVQSDRPADLGALRGRLRSALQRAALPDPDVCVHAVPALPRNPETGKLRRFIPA